MAANWSDDTNQKRSKALKGRKQTPKHIMARVAARKAKGPWFPKKMSPPSSADTPPRTVCDIGFYRGHPTITFKEEQESEEYPVKWRYADTLEQTPQDGEGIERPCIACHRRAAIDGPDPCLGWIPEVTFACCGHGNVSQAYVVFDAGHCLRGPEAVAFFETLHE